VPRSVPEYDVVVEQDVMVPMRDGALMATDIYRPARDGKIVEGRLPVLLNRTPYNKVDNEHSSGYNRWFAERGYIAVTQDCRGCYRSEGDVHFLLPEAEGSARGGHHGRPGRRHRWRRLVLTIWRRWCRI